MKFGKLDQSWWSHYSERAYFDNDPMPRAAFTTKRLFTWAEIVKRGLSPEAKKLMNDAADFGHVEGFVTPIHGVNGELTTVIHMARKTDLSPKERNALHLASIYFSEVGDLLDPEPDGGARKTPQLTARQIEVLTLVARGFTREEIARRLNIAETTVTQHIENAKIKLERPTTMQSVVRALMTGQIRP